jgi:hypothetical protein
MNHQSDYGYSTGAVSMRCAACGSMELNCCDGSIPQSYRLDWVHPHTGQGSVTIPCGTVPDKGQWTLETAITAQQCMEYAGGWQCELTILKALPSGWDMVDTSI